MTSQSHGKFGKKSFVDATAFQWDLNPQSPNVTSGALATAAAVNIFFFRKTWVAMT